MTTETQHDDKETQNSQKEVLNYHEDQKYIGLHTVPKITTINYKETKMQNDHKEKMSVGQKRRQQTLTSCDLHR